MNDYNKVDNVTGISSPVYNNKSKKLEVVTREPEVLYSVEPKTFERKELISGLKAQVRGRDVTVVEEKNSGDNLYVVSYDVNGEKETVKENQILYRSKPVVKEKK